MSDSKLQMSDYQIWTWNCNVLPSSNHIIIPSLFWFTVIFQGIGISLHQLGFQGNGFEFSQGWGRGRRVDLGILGFRWILEVLGLTLMKVVEEWDHVGGQVGGWVARRWRGWVMWGSRGCKCGTRRISLILFKWVALIHRTSVCHVRLFY